MKVKIIAENIGIGNQINMIPLIRQLQSYKIHVVTDCKLLQQLKVCEKSRKRTYYNFFAFGYDLKRILKERAKNPTGFFIGHKHRIFGKETGIGLDKSKDFDPDINEVENNVAMLKYLGLEKRPIKFHLRSGSYINHDKRIAFGISEKPGKKWKHWDIIAKMLTDYEYEVQAFGDYRVKYAKNPNTSTILHVKDYFEEVDYYIGCDCGLTHLADALEIPSLVLFGGTHVTKNRPLNRNYVLSPTVSCAPCYQIYGNIKCHRKQQYECMNYSAEFVFNAFLKLVAAEPKKVKIKKSVFEPSIMLK